MGADDELTWRDARGVLADPDAPPAEDIIRHGRDGAAEAAELRGQRDAMQAALATIAARLEALTKACPVYELEDLLGLADLAERAALGVDDE